MPVVGDELAARVASWIDRQAADRVSVAIDGPDAAGKSTLGDRVSGHVARPCIRASLDDFHRPSAERRARGELSPDGFYHDAFVTGLLEPMKAGSEKVCVRSYDLDREKPERRLATVPTTAALVVDGLFMLRQRLRESWDASVYLHVPESVTLRRAVRRDARRFGSEQNVVRRYTARFLPAQAVYCRDADPVSAASLVVDNSDPDRPLVLRDPRGMLAAD